MTKKNNKNRNLIKIFQWQDYYSWKKMTYKQRLNVKRVLALLLISYYLFTFLSEFKYALIIIILLYFLIRNINKNKISK